MELTKAQLVQMPTVQQMLKEFTALFVSDKPVDTAIQRYENHILHQKDEEPWYITKFQSLVSEVDIAQFNEKTGRFFFPRFLDQNPNYSAKGTLSVSAFLSQSKLWKIRAVRRRSDNVEFEIGDEILSAQMRDLRPTKITAIEMKSDVMAVLTEDGYYPLASIRKLN